MIAVAFTAVMAMLSFAWAAEQPDPTKPTRRQLKAWRRERADISRAWGRR